MKTKISLAVCFLLCAAALAGFALDVVQGNVKLVLYEKTGRWNAFVSKAGAAGVAPGWASGQAFPFFTKEDPRTTLLQILVDNNIYTMGDEGGFRQVVEKTERGARFVWSSPLMRVTQEFMLLTPGDAPLTEGVKIIIKIDNVSEQNHLIGVRCLFDTFLGEKTGTHFVTSANAMLGREVALNAGTGGAYWISPYVEGNAGEGLISLIDAQFATPPESVVFANWKRLYEANWDYKALGNLDFNFYPYSFNDSATVQYYPKTNVIRKTGREIVLVLGNAASYSLTRAPLIAETKPVDDATAGDKDKLLGLEDRPVEETPVEETPVAVAKTDTEEAAKRNAIPVTRFSGSITKPLTKNNFDIVYLELTRLDQFITEINAKILAGTPLTEAELARYRAALADFETKASQKE